MHTQTQSDFNSSETFESTFYRKICCEFRIFLKTVLPTTIGWVDAKLHSSTLSLSLSLSLYKTDKLFQRFLSNSMYICASQNQNSWFGIIASIIQQMICIQCCHVTWSAKRGKQARALWVMFNRKLARQCNTLVNNGSTGQLTNAWARARPSYF